MAAFRQMMSEAEPRGTRWYHPKMGLFGRLGGRVKNTFFVETNNLNTISDCLQQLVNAEEAQLSIEEQLADRTAVVTGAHGAKGRERAAADQRKRRIITARLAVLRHEEKSAPELHQQHNDFWFRLCAKS